MATKKTKTLADVAAVTDVTEAQYIPLADSSGNVTKVSLASLKSALLAGIDLNSINDSVFIMYHRNSDGLPLMVKPDKWPSCQSSGEIADGVVVPITNSFLVVAPTEAVLQWSSTAVNGNTKYTTAISASMAPRQGKSYTKSQIAHAECSGEAYAPGFCSLYSRANAKGVGLTAGKWWLPAMGELLAIYLSMRKINYALSLIEGATQLLENHYWSSIEYSDTQAWTLHLGNAEMLYPSKTAALTKRRVRPVSEFIE